MQGTERRAYESQPEETRADDEAVPRSGEQRGKQAMRQSGGARRDRSINVHDLERAASVLLGAGLALYALKGLSLRRAPAAVTGVALLHRGVSGYCPTYHALGIDTASLETRAPAPISVEQSITIGREPRAVYELFRRPESLGRVMEGFVEVKSAPGGETEWLVRLPLEESIRYVTRVEEERAPDLVRWRSQDGTGPRMEGALELSPAPGDRGTEVTLRMSLEVPGGGVGRALAKLLGPVPKLFAAQALRRLKSLTETGEIPTLHHNPAARTDGRDR